MPELAWVVTINQGQRTYVVQTPECATAGVKAADEWREDPSVTARQHKRGIYDIRIRRAKFSDVSDQIKLSLVEEARTSAIPSPRAVRSEQP